MSPRYDVIGATYTATRRADPRVEAQIRAALGGARRVVNIGGGTGSYETAGPVVAAIDPSPVMLSQRPDGAAPAVQGIAEHLPFRDGAFDAALGIFTIHHWSDWRAGVAEVRRVAGRMVILSWDPAIQDHFWLTTEYLPEALTNQQFVDVTVPELDDALGGVREEKVMVPADCQDGFFAAFWARPEAYLDPTVRAGISCLSLLDQNLVESRIARLADDLASGAWDARHPGLRDQAELDVGYRLIISG
ncbi:MAG: class I SAM-dependent methyltransferase [Acidimicrobiia bacterium]